MVQAMTLEDRKRALERVRAFKSYSTLLEEMLNKALQGK